MKPADPKQSNHDRRRHGRPVSAAESVAPAGKTPLEWAAENGLILEDGNPVPKMLERVPVILRGKRKK